MQDEYVDLQEKCREIRYLLMDTIGKLGVGHVGGCLSAVEALVMLYYRHMHVEPAQPDMNGRDRFVLSKGHAGPALYSILADKGFFEKDWLDTLNRLHTKLPSHADRLLTPGVDMTTGSLGQGLSCATGIALGAKLKEDNARVYALLGDGECQEGQVWEAALYAAQAHLGNLIALTDYNGLQIDGSIVEINGLEPLLKKWESFGWHALMVDGHDLREIDGALTTAKAVSDMPSMILLRTKKGKGVSFAEAAGTASHNMPVSAHQHAMALAEIASGRD